MYKTLPSKKKKINPIQEKIAHLFKEKRAMLGINQAEMAKKLDLTAQTYGNLESVSEHNRAASAVEYLVFIANALEMTPENLIRTVRGSGVLSEGSPWLETFADKVPNLSKNTQFKLLKILSKPPSELELNIDLFSEIEQLDPIIKKANFQILNYKKNN